MDFLNILKSSLSEESVLKHDFLLCYDPSAKILHAFFEGKTDESFYGTYLRKSKPEDWLLKTYVCGNKDGVYFHHEQLNHLHKKEQPLLFFVDKDIEDIIPFPRAVDSNIHVTEFYSVENYLVTSDSIEIIWAEIFKQRSGTEVSAAIKHKFNEALEGFHELFYKVMGWTLFHRRQKNRPNLDCIITKNLFSLDENLNIAPAFTTPDKIYEHLDERTKINTDTQDLAEIELCETELREHAPKYVIRGHNEMDFFIEFYKQLRATTSAASNKSIKPTVEITTGNVIDIMGPRTPQPSSLVSFLEAHLDRQLLLLPQEEQATA